MLAHRCGRRTNHQCCDLPRLSPLPRPAAAGPPAQRQRGDAAHAALVPQGAAAQGAPGVLWPTDAQHRCGGICMPAGRGGEGGQGSTLCAGGRREATQRAPGTVQGCQGRLLRRAGGGPARGGLAARACTLYLLLPRPRRLEAAAAAGLPRPPHPSNPLRPAPFPPQAAPSMAPPRASRHPRRACSRRPRPAAAPARGSGRVPALLMTRQRPPSLSIAP